MSTLANYQGSYNGLTWGPGTEIQLVEIDGLRSMPTITSTDSPRMRAPGSFSGWDVPSGRTINLTLLVVAVSDLETQIGNIEAAFVPLANSTLEMDFQLPSWTAQRCVFCRPRDRQLKVDQNYQFGMAQVTIEVFCPDPRIYSQPTTTTLGATLVNAGNFESRPVLTVAGSGTLTLINSHDSNNQLVLTDSPLGTLSAAGTLTVDVNARTVVDSSGNNRYDLVSSATTWFALQPGANPISVSGGTASCTWRSAWI